MEAELPIAAASAAASPTPRSSELPIAAAESKEPKIEGEIPIADAESKEPKIEGEIPIADAESKEPKIEGELPIAAASAASSTASPTPRPLSPVLWPLDEDVTVNIIGRLDTEVIMRKAELVCKAWCSACKNPDLFRVIDLKYEEGSKLGREEFDDMCFCAVDRSRGELVDMKITNHGEYGLLDYIADRSRKLRRLTLHHYDINHIALVGAVEKLPQLQELHLIMPNRLTAGEFKSIGTSCRSLSSFTYHHYWGADSRVIAEGPNDHASNIAESMPNLRNLRLITDPIQNEGLKAILEKCIHLESLDIRGCFDLRLTGDIRKRCHKIRNLRLPGDSTDDLTSLGWSIQPSDSDAETDDDELVDDDDDDAELVDDDDDDDAELVVL